MRGDQALILRGYECLRNDQGPFTVLQDGGVSRRNDDADG